MVIVGISGISTMTSRPKEKDVLNAAQLEKIAAQPHQLIQNNPQFISAMLKPGMWQWTDRRVVQATSEQKAQTIERKGFAKIKHVQGKFVVIEPTEEKGFRLATEIHSYDRLAKTLHFTNFNAKSIVSRAIGVPDPEHHTIKWKISNLNDDAQEMELTLTCAKDGLSAHLQGKVRRGGTLRATVSGIVERVGDLPESDFASARPKADTVAALVKLGAEIQRNA